MDRHGRGTREALRTLRSQTKKLSIFCTVLIGFLSVCVIYLLFLSSDNQRLREMLLEHNLSLALPGGGGEGELGVRGVDDNVFPLDWNATVGLFVLRPHYALFLPGPLNRDGTNPIGLWLLSPYALYVVVLQAYVNASTIVYAYCVFLVVLQVFKRRYGQRFWMLFVETTPRRWLKGVAFRTLLLCFLSAEIYLMENFSPEIQDRVASFFLLFFITGCFFSGRSYISLMWSLFVSGAVDSIPVFQTPFPLFSPWKDVDSMVPIGKFFVASEWGLLMLSLPSVRMA